MEYRVYLLDQNNHITAAETFSAADDAEAVEVAVSLHDACSDAFAGVEVWCGPKCVLPAGHERSAPIVPRLEDVVEARQNNVLDLEDRLQRSHATMKRSRKLLAVQARLRGTPLGEAAC